MKNIIYIYKKLCIYIYIYIFFFAYNCSIGCAAMLNCSGSDVQQQTRANQQVELGFCSCEGRLSCSHSAPHQPPYEAQPQVEAKGFSPKKALIAAVAMQPSFLLTLKERKGSRLKLRPSTAVQVRTSTQFQHDALTLVYIYSLSHFVNNIV